MASINMFNKEHHTFPTTTTPLSPRISFSNGFLDTQQAYKNEYHYREGPVSSDFEFSVTNYSTMPADELFSEGKLLPSKKTLRDELLRDDEFNHVLFRPLKDTARRITRLGLKKGGNASKKANGNDGGRSAVEKKESGSVREEVQASQTIQELLREAESN